MGGFNFFWFGLATGEAQHGARDLVLTFRRQEAHYFECFFHELGHVEIIVPLSRLVKPGCEESRQCSRRLRLYQDMPHLPLRASECTQPCMRDFAFAMSSLVKKSSGFTLSTGYTGRRKSLS